MTTGIDALDRSVQETNIWLNDVQERLGLASRQQAYRALKATLHAVRDRIGPANAANLGAQLPLLIKGIYFDGFRPEQGPTKERRKETFLEHVDGIMYGGLGLDTEQAVRAVLEVLAAHIDPMEIGKLEKLFPMELRELWPGMSVAEA